MPAPKTIEAAVYEEVDKLHTAEWNPNDMADDRFEQIKQSLIDRPDFFEDRPILASRDGEIYAKNHCYMAARDLGWTHVPVKYRDDLTKKEIRARAIIDNQHWGEQKEDELQKLIEEYGFDPEELGLDKEMQDAIDKLSTPEIEEDTVPEPPKEPKSKLGDLYQLGDHRLLCGDATNVDHVERLMDGEKADQVVTDPPYNVDYEGKTKDALKIKNDKMSDDSFRQFLRDSFSTMDAFMKEGAVFYIWHADLEGYNFRGACHDVGWKVRQCLIWNKNHMVMGRQDYHWKHEPCLYGWKEGAGHLWATDRKQVTVLYFDRPQQNKEHPTMKPIELIAYQIKNNTKGSDIVLDLFGGGGSTLIACEQLNRKCYMMELDPRYIDVIIERWENLTGEKAVLLSNK